MKIEGVVKELIDTTFMIIDEYDKDFLSNTYLNHYYI